MSRDARKSGMLVLSNPIHEDEVGRLPRFELGYMADIKLVNKRFRMEIPGVTRRTFQLWAVGFCPTDGENRLGYPEQDVEVAIAWAAERERTLTGYIQVNGEDDDIWRYRVENGAVVTERPKLIWPNGEETGMKPYDPFRDITLPEGA